MDALGFIETIGLPGAIAAADVMVKAADVRLLERHQAGGGLVTVTVTGEVSAVKAAVDAAVHALANIRGVELRSHHVIARPYDEITAIIPAIQVTIEETEGSEDFDKTPQKSTAASQAKNEEPQAVRSWSAAELREMTVARLRELAATLDGMSLTSQQIRTATKKKLIEAIVNHHSRR